MSETYLGPVYTDPVWVLPLALQQAAFAPTPVLVKGGEPVAVTILLELDFNNLP